MAEVWKPLLGIVECGDYYEVSNLGNVRNIGTLKVLKYRRDLKGYGNVCLYYNKKSKQYGVHRLVALAFLPNPDNKPEVNHKDGIKVNNLVTNLEWATPRENIRHAMDNGLIDIPKGMERPNATLTDEDVVKIKQLLIQRVSSREIGRQMSISSHIVDAIKKGRSWTHVHVEGFSPFVYDHKGESVRTAKLNKDKVVNIRELHATGEYSFSELGRMYSISPSSIRDVVTRKSWKHVD
jgi:hypothetical protein